MFVYWMSFRRDDKFLQRCTVERTSKPSAVGPIWGKTCTGRRSRSQAYNMRLSFARILYCAGLRCPCRENIPIRAMDDRREGGGLREASVFQIDAGLLLFSDLQHCVLITRAAPNPQSFIRFLWTNSGEVSDREKRL